MNNKFYYSESFRNLSQSFLATLTSNNVPVSTTKTTGPVKLHSLYDILNEHQTHDIKKDKKKHEKKKVELKSIKIDNYIVTENDIEKNDSFKGKGIVLNNNKNEKNKNIDQNVDFNKNQLELEGKENQS